MCVVPDGIDTFFDIECIVVNLAVSGVARRIQRSHIFILADIVTECVVNGLPATEHNGTCCISMAVVVLIVCSITIIRIPRLSVSITIGSIQCCKTFVVLENCIFTFPWPDTCCYSSCTNTLFAGFVAICIQSRLLLGVICGIDLLRCIL